jgi:poly(A) polymerase
MTERDYAYEVVERLQRAGFQALWAGGCVRDEQLGLVPADYDVATNAVPDQVKRIFKRCHSFGASFGVVEVLGPRDDQGEWLKVQVATFRNDGVYTDGRRPDSVTFSSAQEDAQRRDFTINGLFYDPICKEVIDYVGGLADIQAKVLRAIGNPFDRFREDKLRILRAVRMATRFELQIDPATLSAAQQMANGIEVVSAERIAEELRKLLSHKQSARGLKLLIEFHLFGPIFPNLQAIPTDVILSLVNDLNRPVSFELALATILSPAGITSAIESCSKLKLSNEERHRICWLIQHHESMQHAHNMKPAELYPLLANTGIAELLALTQVHLQHQQLSFESIEHCQRLLLEKTPVELTPPPLVTGEDLKRLGFGPGPEFKRMLVQIRSAQLNGELRSHEEAVLWLKNQSQTV